MECSDWKVFWERARDHPRIFRPEAEHYVARLERTVPLSVHWRLLDFGCGFGHVAEVLAPKVREVFIWDAVENVRQCAKINVTNRQNVKCLDALDLRELSQALKFDLILVNSVAQYMPSTEFCSWVRKWKNMLAPRGRIVISDLIPEKGWPLLDVLDLLQFSACNGILFRTVWQKLGVLAEYWKMGHFGALTRFNPEDLERLAAESGLTATFPAHNFTYRQRRFTVILSPH